MPRSPARRSRFFIPPRPARLLEHDLHPPVAYAILPLFAFANAGVSLEGVSLASLAEPVPLGIATGLLCGKLAGVFVFSFLMIRLGGASLPEGAGWGGLFGVSLLCGVGFTMSLFIAGLAFEGADAAYMAQARLGILLGSLASAVAGYALLRVVLPARGSASASP